MIVWHTSERVKIAIWGLALGGVCVFAMWAVENRALQSGEVDWADRWWSLVFALLGFWMVVGARRLVAAAALTAALVGTAAAIPRLVHDQVQSGLTLLGIANATAIVLAILAYVLWRLEDREPVKRPAETQEESTQTNDYGVWGVLLAAGMIVAFFAMEWNVAGTGRELEWETWGGRALVLVAMFIGLAVAGFEKGLSLKMHVVTTAVGGTAGVILIASIEVAIVWSVHRPIVSVCAAIVGAAALVLVLINERWLRRRTEADQTARETHSTELR